MTDGDIDNNSRVSICDLGQCASHGPNIRLAEPLENILGLSSSLVKGGFDVGKSRGLSRVPFRVHIVSDLTGKETDEIKDFIDHTGVLLG